MQCYFCDTPLQRVGCVDTAERDGEMTIEHLCPGCGKRYQAQLRTIAIFAYTPNHEEALLLLRHCQHCKQLYRDGAGHVCETYPPP